jgi:hypothetical protein
MNQGVPNGGGAEQSERCVSVETVQAWGVAKGIKFCNSENNTLEGRMHSSKVASALLAFVFTLSLTSASSGQQASNSSQANSKKKVESGSKVYVAPMDGGFDISLVAAIVKKQLPVVVVADKAKADYEISGISQSDKAGWAKMLFLGTDASNEQASIKVVDLKSEEVVFGYNVKKENSARGRQSAAEACAKHLKENIEGK